MQKKDIGQLFVVGYQGLNPSDEFLRFVDEWGIGGVIVFARNIDNPENLPGIIKRIEEASGQKIFSAIDQEGGPVMRILSGGSLFHSAMGLAATGDVRLAEKSYEAIGKEMLALGLNWNLAPVLDINHPDNPGIGSRSFGEDPQTVAKFGIAAIKGLQSAGVLACAKHFPGKGKARVDSHLTLPVIASSVDELENFELFPFKEAIKNKVDAIMTAHVFFPAYESAKNLPATLSHSVLTGLLRQKLGFEGLLITDDLEMGAITEAYGIAEAAARSFQAGADLLLICHQIEQQKAAAQNLLKLVNNEAVYADRFQESSARISKAKASLGSHKKSSDLIALAKKHEAIVIETHEKSLHFARFDRKMLECTNEDNIVFVCPEIASLVQVEEVHQNHGLESIIKREFSNAAVCHYDPKSNSAEIIKHFDAQFNLHRFHFDKLVFFSYNAHLFKGQADAANTLAQRYKNSAVVALRNPYDLNLMKNFKTAIAAFSFRTPAINAVLKALKGNLKPDCKNCIPVLAN
ncbi:MAG: beta-N-acetylhexosaminidase [Candidatus Rifleibacteriota bacterium]